MVGTMVRDRTYEASIANTTASAKGRKRYRATPESRNIGANTMIDVRIASGMEVAMISVLRQLPRNTRIMIAVRQAAISASRTTPLIAPFTKMDWSASGDIFNCCGTVAAIRGRIDLIPEITSSVEASPAF